MRRRHRFSSDLQGNISSEAGTITSIKVGLRGALAFQSAILDDSILGRRRATTISHSTWRSTLAPRQRCSACTPFRSVRLGVRPQLDQSSMIRQSAPHCAALFTSGGQCDIYLQGFLMQAAELRCNGNANLGQLQCFP